MTSSGSHFLLDSDSDSDKSFTSDSSDDKLPTYDVCSPEKRQRLLSSNNAASLPGMHTAMPPKSSTAPQQEPASTPTRRLTFPNASGVQFNFDASPRKNQKLKSSPVNQSKSTLSPNRTSSSNQVQDFVGSPHQSYKSMSSISSPPLGATLSASPSDSPLQLVERHERTLHQHTRLTKKMETVTAKIKSRMEKNSKLEEFRQGGGIRGLSKGLEIRDTNSVSSDGEDEMRPFVSSRNKQQLKEDDKFFLPLHPPGMPLLVRPAALLTTLSPPSNMSECSLDLVEENGLTMEGSGSIRHFICDCWPVVKYATMPCPMHIWEWLFEISCLCCDVVVSKASLSNLIHLLEVAQASGREDWPVLVPTSSQVLHMLQSLGTDKKKLQSESLQQTKLEDGESCGPGVCPPGVLEDSESCVPGVCPPGVLVGLTHLFSYLNQAMQCRPSVNPTEDVLHLIVHIAVLSLDSTLLQLNDLDLVLVMTATLLSLLASIPDHSWPHCRDVLASRLQAVASHHHDCLHVCDVLLPSSPRSEELCRLIIQHFLKALLFTAEEAEASKSIKDWQLAWRVVKFYHDKHSHTFDYYSMYSAMSMLCLLMASSSEMNWPSRQEAEMKSMLADLGLVRIRDNTDRTEKVPVKQLFIYFKLEMDTRSRGKSLCQMNLLDAYNN